MTPFHPTDVGATIRENGVVYPTLYEALFMTGAAYHEFDFDTYTPSWITSNWEEDYFQWISRNSVLYREAATYLSIGAYDNDDYGVFDVTCQGGFTCSNGPPWPTGVLTIEWDF